MGNQENMFLGIKLRQLMSSSIHKFWLLSQDGMLIYLHSLMLQESWKICKKLNSLQMPTLKISLIVIELAYEY
jgi:TRAP-type C4-dicarboxylate transport system permease small subunit